MTEPQFLPGVPAEYVLERLARSPGNELASGKLVSPRSSAALAVNCFAWFHPCPALLPPLPGMPAGFLPTAVEIEYKAAFPWRGGHHPWLDAAILDGGRLFGIESKRFEPFLDKKTGAFSKAYDRDVWGDGMEPFIRMKNRLQAGELKFEHLDAAQLVKHAFGLVTDGRRKGLEPALVYLFAEPATFADRPIAPAAKARHRAEVDAFAREVEGAAVGFLATSYREWISRWDGASEPVRVHGRALLEAFAL